VLALGTRFLDGAATPTYSSASCRFIYVNIDPQHSGPPRQDGSVLTADVRATLKPLIDALKDLPPRPSRAAQIALVKAWCHEQISRIQPQSDYVHALRRALPEDAIVVSELTQIGYFANIAFPVEQPRSYLTPGYQGTLGYGFPTSLGAAVGSPRRRVVSITGDGGFGWGMQELSTAVRYRLNLTVIVFADGRFGNVQRIQRRVFGHEFATEVVNPDFQTLAAAFGVPFRRVSSPAELGEALAGTAGAGPVLIEARVGEMPSPWALIHPFVMPATPPPPNPLGVPAKPGATH
jgi:acetolactate synthase-1/2/3 large subunit